MRVFPARPHGFVGDSFLPLIRTSARCCASTLKKPDAHPPLKSTRGPPARPLYYNFSTPHLYPSFASGGGGDSGAAAGGSGHRRTRRFSSSPPHLHAEDPSSPLERTPRHGESADQSNDIKIFRRDMADVHGGKTFALSVDVPPKKFLDMFCDFDSKRCKLCNDTFVQWHSHQGAIPHAGREALLLELVRAFCGTPEEICRMWWHRLHTSTAFRRIPALSHDDSHVRKRRLQFLLRLLKDRQILRDTFNVMQSAQSSAGRTWEFERLEWVGDNVVKYLFNNRLNCVFPVSEGGIRGRLGYSQFIIDGNDGLARAYDYLELQQLTQSDRVVSKFKSDVVETLFGELQLYLWATEVDAGTEYFPMPFTKDMHSVRALVAHTMEELGHVMFMYHVEYLHGCLQRILRENQLQVVKADPALRSQLAELSLNDHAASVYARKAHAAASTTKLSATRVTHSQHGGSGSSLFMASANYDSFKRVVPLGGLLPCPFKVSELAVTPVYMPHLQVVLSLTESIRQSGLHGDLVMNAATERQRETDDEECFQISHEPVAASNDPAAARSARLSIPQLKDEELIPELL